jgi:aldehyde dehydrogenase (NAD+)
MDLLTRIIKTLYLDLNKVEFEAYATEVGIFYKELNNEQYPKIIHQNHFDRLNQLLEKSKIHYGGRSNKVCLKIEPTIIDQPDESSSVMQE